MKVLPNLWLLIVLSRLKILGDLQDHLETYSCVTGMLIDLILDWKFPEKDGGAPVTHYIMEMREAGPGAPEGEESWKEVGQSDGPKCFFSMGGLTKGAKYQFRARSVNKGGVSEPCDPTPIVSPKPRKCKLASVQFFTNI